MAAILSPLGLYGGHQKSEVPLLANWGYMPLNGEFGNLCHRSIGRMPSDCKLALPRRKPCDPDVCPPL
jgi:hypothetical protein